MITGKKAWCMHITLVFPNPQHNHELEKGDFGALWVTWECRIMTRLRKSLAVMLAGRYSDFISRRAGLMYLYLKTKTRK